LKISYYNIGKTTLSYLEEGITIYEKRIKNYIRFETIVIPELKNTKNISIQEQKEREADLLLSKFNDSDYIVLLDEAGKLYTSIEFSKYIEHKTVSSINNMVFIIGGPYGFSDKIYKRANEKISLSKMTFSHQMIRLLFIEQLYRAFTIIKGEPYHHE